MNSSNLSNYDTVNPVIVEYIKKSGIKDPRILDVGCSGGNLGAKLKRIGFECEIDGIDNDRSALSVAFEKRSYVKTYYLDLNNADFYEIDHQGYDIIVFGDVLEHTIYPELVVKKIISKLKPGGILIISFPNVAFVKYRLLHLAGQWKYTDCGIMDRTHLRFFTLASMRKFFENVNLQIIEFRPLTAVPKIYAIVKLLAKIWPSMFALQIVFKLKQKT